MKPKKKKAGFIEGVTRVFTGKTKEQRRADARAKARAKKLELRAYRREQIGQAERIGKAKAKFRAEQQIKAIGKPKPLLDLGGWGKTKEGFNPLTFGAGTGLTSKKGAKGKTPVAKGFTVQQAIGFDPNKAMSQALTGKAMKEKVKKKIRKKRIKKKRKKKGTGKTFTIRVK